MSGETGAVESGWSVDTLKAYFERILVENQVALTAALVAQEKQTGAALNAAEKAILKAETATEKRFEGVNEFRMALDDQTKLQLPRAEAASQFSSLENQVSVMRDALGAMLPREVYDQVLTDFQKWRSTIDVNATGYMTVAAWERHVQRQRDEQLADRRQRTGLFVAVVLSAAGTLFTLLK